MSNPEGSGLDFETLLRRHGPAIYTLAARLTGNTADGEDLAQKTFIKVYKSLERFRGESDAYTWIYRICVNEWKNQVRYEKRRSFWKHFSLGSRDDEDESAPAFEPAANDPPMGQAIESEQKQAAVRAALAQLEPEDRAIIVLRDIENRSHEEISALLDLPVGTVKSRLSRSRQKLKQFLDPMLGE